MLKILIADDEVSIIQLIKKLISPEIAHEIVGETTDGKSALSMIEAAEPDIVITDIRMPGLNGIELLKEARDRGSAAEFMIISGYKDFQYAQSAIQYGVCAYLLKPIKADELNGALLRVCAKQGETKKLQIRIADMENTIAQNRKVKRREYLAAFAERISDPSALLEKAELTGFSDLFHVQQGIFAVLILKLDFEERAEADFVAENLKVLGEKYCRAIEGECHDLESCCQGSRYYLLFHTGKNYFHEIIRRIDQLMRDRISQYSMYQLSAAVGAGVEHFGQLGYAFLTADYMLIQRLLCGTGKLLVFPEKERLEKIQISEETKQNLERVLYELDSEAFKEVFSKIYREISDQYHRNPYYVKIYLEELTVQVIRWLNKEEKPGEPEIQNRRSFLWKETDFCCCMDEIYEMCLKNLTEQINQAAQKHKDGISRPIKRMKTYIREHYADNLSLDDIVGAAELSNAYGSSIFKKETGMTITNYVTKVRMEEAQRLIRETNLTINEVAYKVGYSDTRYFSKLFIKTVGIKPVDYRKFYN